MPLDSKRYWREGLKYLPPLAGIVIMAIAGGLAFTSARSTSIDHARAHAPALVARTPSLPPVAPQTFEQLAPERALAINASVPFSSLPNPAASPFKIGGANAADHARALTCLTMAVYYEAASQSDEGQAAVAQVVLNRLRNPLFPKTVCGVVFQGSTLPTGCQFTFTCDGSLNRRPSASGWKRAGQIAERALGGYVQKDVGEATHYHTMWVVPYWQATVVKVAQIGAHIFYRWPGDLGRPGAFRAEYAGAEPLPGGAAGLVNDLPASASAAPAAPPPRELAVADTPAVTVTAPTASVEVAAVALQKPQVLADDLRPGADGYFGRPSTPQRLPMASRW
jgi:spore germination cell wall hydrolase CwlJ-like protein